MDSSYEEENEEAAPLISVSGIPTAVRDIRQPYERQRAVYFILASTLFERMAFYTLAANIALNLESIKDNGGQFSISSIASFIFAGTSYISTLIFAVISDAKLGRAKTIIIGYIIYLIGYISAILVSLGLVYGFIQNVFNEDSKWPLVWVIGTVVIVAMGAGAVESNIAVFGMEQISKISSRYFDKYIIAVNMGGIISALAVRFLYKYIPAQSVGHKYLIPCIVIFTLLVVSGLLFIIGWRYYIHVDPHDTVITNCIPVTFNAFQSWRKYKPNNQSTDSQNINSIRSNLMDDSYSVSDEENSRRLEHRPSTFLDFAKAANHGKYPDRIVDDVKSLRGALLVFMLLIPYWLVYTQLSSTFPLQGRYMHGGDDDIKNTYMWLGDPVTIIVCILSFNLLAYKYENLRNRSLTIATKFIIGMCFAIFTMCIAGTVEKFRQDECDMSYNNRSNISVLIQLPQNIFMGFSEIFAMVASFEFAYFAAPRSAQTLFMSLRFCSMGIASFIGAGYFTLFSFISPNSKNKSEEKNQESFFQCPYDKTNNAIFYSYFFALAGLQFIFVIIFISCQKKYQIIKMNPQQTKTNQFLRHSSSNKTSSNRQ